MIGMKGRDGIWAALGIVALMTSGSAAFIALHSPEPSRGLSSGYAGEDPEPGLPIDIQGQAEAYLFYKPAQSLEILVKWIRSSLELRLDWKRIKSIRVHAYSTSLTDGQDPNNIVIKLGQDALLSVENLYSMLRHELIHVRQSADRESILERGRGWMEVEAFLWEVEHAGLTGLDRPAQFRRTPAGALDRRVGVPRVMNGLFDAMDALAADLKGKPTRLTQKEIDRIKTRFSCAVRRYWDVARELKPALDVEELSPCPTI